MAFKNFTAALLSDINLSLLPDPSTTAPNVVLISSIHDLVALVLPSSSNATNVYGFWEVNKDKYVVEAFKRN
ncbi:hypothetical protein [Thalassotalea euphylliae]|uniref:Uncharacterized protein n=1 Tax=Thalassotalea euphylliae TaxID=1655234 RepID=A0A3E0UHS0_9GAMM|nr:hypothetical protein [Thalassotalea euphylliae]REL36548.1 hypothetical protein DXX92_15160 [Thalassotalea euphylliae]